MTITAHPPLVPRDTPRGYVALATTSPADELALVTCPLPTRRRETSDGLEWQVHASSVPTLAALKVVDLAASNPHAVNAVRAYAVEARRTFDKNALTALPPDAASFLDFLYVAPGHYKPRPYQLAGMSRLYARCMNPAIMGCVLADDVGLGKTVQVVGVVLRMIAESEIDHENPAVVVTTASTVTQWAGEFHRFARTPPTLALVAESASKKLLALEKSAAVYVLNYETLRLPRYRYLVEMLAERVRFVAFDEASAVANPNSKTHDACYRFARHALYRLCLNATPIENALQDYYSQLRIINERIVGEPEGFAGRYLELSPDGRIVGARNVREFRVRTAGLYIRRTAEMVGEQLPPLSASIRSVTMGKVQAEAYDRALRQCFARGNAGAGVMSIENVSAIQRAACAADLKDPASPSAKMDDLEHLLATELRDRRVLVFSRLATIADYVHRRLAPLGPTFLITGSTSQHQRDRIKAEFSRTPGAVLVGSDAISKGLNLQAADVVVNLDLPWHPGKLRQRAGRSHRIGQEKPVTVINYRARHPARKRDVDTFFLSKILRKQGLVDEVFGRDSVDVLGDNSEIAVAASAMKYLAGK